jgi:nitrate/nitrite-specific signal transduction histidine kinase
MSLTVSPGIFQARSILDVTGDAFLLDATVESALVNRAEALTNAVKHSSATRITVELDFAPAVPCGLSCRTTALFDANAVRPDAYGLVSMQERAARARVPLTLSRNQERATIIASWSPETGARA